MSYSNCIQAIGNTRFTEGEAWIIPMRLVWPDGAYFDTSTTGTDGIVDIDVAVFDLDSESPTVLVYGPTLTVASVLYATLQTDGYWTVDNTGYNARLNFAVGFTDTSGGHRYAVELTFNPHASNVYGQKVARFIVTVDEAGRT